MPRHVRRGGTTRSRSPPRSETTSAPGRSYRVVRTLMKTSPGSSSVSFRPKYNRLPSPDRDARVSEAGVLIDGSSMRCGADHGALVLGHGRGSVGLASVPDDLDVDHRQPCGPVADAFPGYASKKRQVRCLGTDACQDGTPRREVSPSTRRFVLEPAPRSRSAARLARNHIARSIFTRTCSRPLDPSRNRNGADQFAFLTRCHSR